MKAARVFVNSFPKSGTNLVEKLVRQFGYSHSGRSIAFSSVCGRYTTIKRITRACSLRNVQIPIGLEVPAAVSAGWLKKYVRGVAHGSYFSGHAAWSGYLDDILQSEGIKVVQVIRDPRGILASMASYVVEEQNAWYPFHRSFKSLPRRELLKFYIKGGYVPGAEMFYSGIREALSRAEGWLHSSNAIVVRFEDLVGAKGGGSDESQLEAITQIANFIDAQGVDIQQIQQSLFGGTHTFRGGQIDRWVSDFDQGLLNQISSELSNEIWLARLGYLFK
ncbi:MAG: sulfotransferase domain-containing protein [Alphaproteobacteria bacterium]